MLFHSIAFAVFLPIVFALYWAAPHKYRGMIILVASYYFYMCWKPVYALLILAVTIVSYFAALAIDRKDKTISPRVIVSGSTVFCLSILFLFKYFNFFVETLTAATGVFFIHLHPVTLRFLLPVGISFYTFQAMSYVFDVYRGKIKAESSFFEYAAFISFFPQLIAGPIERAGNLLPQIKKQKTFDYDRAMYGARQMLWGFFKKIAVADLAAIYVDAAYSNLERCSSLDLCIAIFFFTIQIYCDFSGYSDIAAGTAKLFGINLMSNFQSPYFSTSITEFWSRWHISLSTWFRDYVYIPLGGSKGSKIRTSFNIMITFLISGLWHGANWTFVVWGGMHGAVRVIENIIGGTEKKNRKKPVTTKILLWIAVFAFCNLTWVFFRAESISDALYVIKCAFGNFSNPAEYLQSNTGLSVPRFLFISASVIIVFLYDYVSLKVDLIKMASTKNKAFIAGIEYVLLAFIVTAIILGSGTKQFVYFQF